MTSLIINLLFAVFYLQSLSCEVITKSHRSTGALQLQRCSSALVKLQSFVDKSI